MHSAGTPIYRGSPPCCQRVSGVDYFAPVDNFGTFFVGRSGVWIGGSLLAVVYSLWPFCRANIGHYRKGYTPLRAAPRMLASIQGQVLPKDAARNL